MNKTTELTTNKGFDLSPQTFDQALTFSKYLADSDMVPKNFRNKPGDCLIAMQWGYEVGLKPLQALQSIAVINGKPGLYGDAGKAILLSAGCIIEEDDIAVVERNVTARCKITRPGHPPTERTYSLENAKTAGLWNKEGPWRTSPWRQMAWRAFWFAARDSAADLLKGLPGAEEVIDMLTGEIKHMGMPEVVTNREPASLPAYDDAKFAHNLKGSWQKRVNEGGEAAALLAMFKTRNSLTAEQEASILALKPVIEDWTLEKVDKRLREAGDIDALYIAADLISQVADEEQAKHLNTIFNERLAALKGE